MSQPTRRRFVHTLASTLAAPPLGLGAASALAADAPTAALPALDAFFGESKFGGAILSPNGKSLAVRVSPKGEFTQLAVLDLDTLKPTVVAGFDEAGIGALQWVNDQRLVFNLYSTYSGPGLYAVDRDGSNFRQLVEATWSFVKAPDGGVPLLPGNTYLLHSLGRQDTDEVFVVSPGEMSKEKVDYIDLRRLNTRTGRVQEVESPLHSFGWLLDAQGVLRVAVTRLKNVVAVHLRDNAGGWKKIAEYEDIGAGGIDPVFIGPDGTIYAQAPLGDKTAVFTLDPATGKLSDKPIAQSKDFDVHAGFVVNDQKLLGLRYHIDAEITQWFDTDAKALQAKIDALLPSTANRVTLPKRGGSPWVLVESFADQQPWMTQLYQRETGKLLRVGVSHPAIKPAQMGQTDFIRYKARDGLDIPAYITLPAGGVKKNLPLVVLVHGGPWVRGFSWQWDAEVQFLASRGYAVLQPEFRGSTGFGGKHFHAGWKQWGQAMQDDVADGTRWAIAQGIADPKRICIAGASYGGYATLMGLIKDPDLYRCGINWVGVTDINLMYTVSWSDFSGEWKRYGMPRMVGDPMADAAMLKANSPLENAARVSQPLLMAYGGRDVRVPLVHGEKFRDAVTKHNKQVEWVVYPEEGHGWHKAETRIDFWGRVEKFLARNLAL
jgi:dipeptidyl aminopeptidase/acylaminoacyl peptidase